MSYQSTCDLSFLDTLGSWFRAQPEVLVLIRYSHAAGSRAWEFYPSLQSLVARIGTLEHNACITVFRSPQLPIRGNVNDELIAKCLNSIPDGSEFLVVEVVRRVYGQASWFPHAGGESHSELLEILENLRGTSIAAGLFPPWLIDTDDVLSAVVPDENGSVNTGVY